MVEGGSLGIVQETEVSPYYQMVYAQAKIFHGIEKPQNSLGLSDTNASLSHIKKARPNFDYQETKMDASRQDSESKRKRKAG